MKDRFVIISFYTIDTLYEKEIQNLIHSCKHFGLEYDIIGVKNLGNWNANCHLKPPFILDRLKKHQCPVLWLDADSTICGPLTFFNSCSEDFMVRIREDVNFNHHDKVISSSVFVKNTPKGLKVVKKWCEESLSLRNKFCDQECLKIAIEKHNLFNIAKSIPIEYCHVNGLDPEKETIYIRQLQASRLLKKIIDQEVAEFSFFEDLSPEELQKIRFSK